MSIPIIPAVMVVTIVIVVITMTAVAMPVVLVGLANTTVHTAVAMACGHRIGAYRLACTAGTRSGTRSVHLRCGAITPPESYADAPVQQLLSATADLFQHCHSLVSMWRRNIGVHALNGL
jgi:hypothetical protein